MTQEKIRDIKGEQLVFTAAEINGIRGYQTVALSPGANQEIIRQLSDYMLPAGIRQGTKFKESRQMLVLSDLVALSLIKNIGTGYDGRPNTLYNHTILLQKEDFLSANADPAITDTKFTIDPTIKGELPSISLRISQSEPKVEHPNEIFGSKEILVNLLQVLFACLSDRVRMALVIDRVVDCEALIRNLLVCLPERLRLMSYSTFVEDLDIQKDFRLFAVSAEYAEIVRSESNVMTTSISNPSNSNDRRFIQLSRYVAWAVWENENQAISELHQLGNFIATETNTANALTYLNKLQETHEPLGNAALSKTHLACALLALSFSGERASEHFQKAREYSLESKDSAAISETYLESIRHDLQTHPGTQPERLWNFYKEAVHSLSNLDRTVALSFVEVLLGSLSSDQTLQLVGMTISNLNKEETEIRKYDDDSFIVSVPSIRNELIILLQEGGTEHALIVISIQMLQVSGSKEAAAFFDDLLGSIQDIRNLEGKILSLISDRFADALPQSVVQVLSRYSLEVTSKTIDSIRDTAGIGRNRIFRIHRDRKTDNSEYENTVLKFREQFILPVENFLSGAKNGNDSVNIKASKEMIKMTEKLLADLRMTP